MLTPSNHMAALWPDIRAAIRSLTCHRAFAAASIATLALGIGATTAIFTVVNAVVLRPLPFPRAHQLVRVSATPPERGEAVDFADLQAYRTESRSLAAIAGYGVSARYLGGAREPERVMAVLAERWFFDVLGVPPQSGRTFRLDDPHTVAVVRESFATRLFGSAVSAIGSRIVLDDESLTVVGVMPESFQFPYRSGSTLQGARSETRTDVWVAWPPMREPVRGRASGVVARLTPSVTVQAAASELRAIAARVDAARPPEAAGRGVTVQALADAVVPPALRKALAFLFAAVTVVLLLACANVTNLSVAQATLRQREIAIRSAMGASPARLTRQQAVESLLLSLVGGAVGLWLAWFATNSIVEAVAPYLARAGEVSVDWVVFLFLLSVCSLATLVAGAIPALAARKVNPQIVLTDAGGLTTTGVAHPRLRDALVLVEVALAFLLVVSAAALVRELARLERIDPGFTSRNVLTLHLGHRMTPQSDARQFVGIAERVSSLPGVAAAGFTQMLPLQHWGWQSASADLRVQGRPSPTPPFAIEMRYVTPGYFEAIGMSLVRGRGFTEADGHGAPRVIVVNETLARRYFPDADPVGQQTTRGTVIGVVRDVRQVHLDRAAQPEMYFPVTQNWSQVPELGMTLVVRTISRPERLAPAIRSAVREVNPHLAVFNVRTLDEVVADSLSTFAVYLRLMAAFSVLALVLAAVGTYAVVSCLASARRREFAIRIALGAKRPRLITLILARTGVLAGAGLLAGAAVTRLAVPLLRGLPVEVQAPDMATAGSVAFLIALVAVVASLVPARRAASADLSSTLRND